MSAPPTTAGAPARSGPGTPPGPAWVVFAAALAFVLAALAWIEPALPLAVLIALTGVLIAAFRPKLFVLLALVVIILSAPIQNVLGQVGTYADEGVIALAFVALSTRRLVTEGRLVWLPGTGWFLGFLVAGLVSAALAEVPAGLAVPAAFIAVKGVVFAFAIAQLHWTRDDLALLVRLGVTAIVVMAFTALLNLALPAAWANFTTGRPPISYIGPFPAINGVFQHPAAFSRFSGVLAVGALVYGLVVRRSLANTILVLLSGGLAFLTFQVKSIVGLLATLAAVGTRFLRPVGVAALLAVGPLVALLTVPPLAALIGGDIDIYLNQDSARSMLTAGGVTVAAQFFPLGAGFGRYGSSTAADDYSPLYYALGFPGRYGLGPGPDSGQFLNDSQWPAIYGETGWFGAFCFAAGLACMLVALLRRVSAREDVLVRWMRITGVGWLVLLLVESAVAPVFVSSPSFPFVFAAAGVIASLRVDARQAAALGRPPVTGHREPTVP
ncbi:hypothetical protein [Modestobacter caceresii]|uniref:hypothetical protein n=1 Tax=Modestobacter caceresii TaxID=1522368 RepID=UPI0018CCE7F6|nr:hypothetical protein [Modestobacter caceresii]